MRTYNQWGSLEKSRTIHEVNFVISRSAKVAENNSIPIEC